MVICVWSAFFFLSLSSMGFGSGAVLFVSNFNSICILGVAALLFLHGFSDVVWFFFLFGLGGVRLRFLWSLSLLSFFFSGGLGRMDWIELIHNLGLSLVSSRLLEKLISIISMVLMLGLWHSCFSTFLVSSTLIVLPYINLASKVGTSNTSIQMFNHLLMRTSSAGYTYCSREVHMCVSKHD